MFGVRTIIFDLQPKKVGTTDVAGLSKLSIFPADNDFLHRILMLIESLADSLPVVAFVEPHEVNFYAERGWYVGRLIEGKYFVSSEPVNDNKFDGIIW